MVGEKFTDKIGYLLAYPFTTSNRFDFTSLALPVVAHTCLHSAAILSGGFHVFSPGIFHTLFKLFNLEEARHLRIFREYDRFSNFFHCE